MTTLEAIALMFTGGAGSFSVIVRNWPRNTVLAILLLLSSAASLMSGMYIFLDSLN